MSPFGKFFRVSRSQNRAYSVMESTYQSTISSQARSLGAPRLRNGFTESMWPTSPQASRNGPEPPYFRISQTRKLSAAYLSPAQNPGWLWYGPWMSAVQSLPDTG